MTRILITGSRDWPDMDSIVQTLGTTIIGLISKGETKDTITLIHGQCPTGADAMADWVARAWNMNIERYPADWVRYGKKAGMIRNKQMVDTGVDICLAFVYNKSSGASNTVKLCRERGIELILLER